MSEAKRCVCGVAIEHVVIGSTPFWLAETEPGERRYTHLATDGTPRNHYPASRQWHGGAQ